MIHLISATINYVNAPHPHDKKGFLLFLDFEKAFDSVNHEFIYTLMASMNFPPSFIRWVSLGLTNTQACCIVNGKRSPFFDMPGGGRQGDNLFPLIFSIVVQGLHSLVATFPVSGILLPHSDKPETNMQTKDTQNPIQSFKVRHHIQNGGSPYNPLQHEASCPLSTLLRIRKGFCRTLQFRWIYCFFFINELAN